MKKLMIAAAIVCAAAFAQAAQYTWTASYVYNGYATGDTGVDGTAYLFLNSGETLRDTVFASVEAGTFISDGYTALDNADMVGGNVVEKLTPSDKLAGVTGDSFYVVVVADDNAFVGSLYTPAIVETIGSTTLLWDAGDGYGLYNESIAPGAWVAQSVPEPTSGLLLLLGVAGLALKRRRA